MAPNSDELEKAQHRGLIRDLTTVLEKRNAEIADLRAHLAGAQKDAERWRKVESLMTHERAGPHFGWCISEVLPGDSPAEAIDAAIEKEKQHG